MDLVHCSGILLLQAGLGEASNKRTQKHPCHCSLRLHHMQVAVAAFLAGQLPRLPVFHSRTEGTSHMLIDFSDILQVDVYELGRTYLRLSQVSLVVITLFYALLYSFLNRPFALTSLPWTPVSMS